MSVHTHIGKILSRKGERLEEYFRFFDNESDSEPVKSSTNIKRQGNQKEFRKLNQRKLEELKYECEHSFGGEWKIRGDVLVPSSDAVFSSKHFVKFANSIQRNLPGLFKESCLGERLGGEEESDFYRWCDEEGVSPHDLGAWDEYLEQGGDPYEFHGYDV